MSASNTVFKCLTSAQKKCLCHKHLHPNFPEPYRAAPEPSGTSPAICTGTLRNLTRYLHRSPPNPHKVLYLHRNPPERICTRTLRNLNRYPYRNPPEPHQVSAPEPSRTSPAICTGTLWNLLNRYLHRNLPEPHQVSPPEPSVSAPETLQNLTMVSRTRASLG